MLIVTLTGLLNIILGITLVLLVTIILEKERPEDADNLDRVLLIIFAISLSVSLGITGFLVMAGVAKDIAIDNYLFETTAITALKVVAIVAGWTKILRTVITYNRR